MVHCPLSHNIFLWGGGGNDKFPGIEVVHDFYVFTRLTLEMSSNFMIQLTTLKIFKTSGTGLYIG